MFVNTIPELIHILESESNITVNWFKTNNIIVNPEKFHAIIINKNSQVPITIHERPEPCFHEGIICKKY